jgi:hypothetical protein
MKLLILGMLMIGQAHALETAKELRVDETMTATAIEVNNSWGDTLAEGAVKSIESEGAWERVSKCELLVTAKAIDEDDQTQTAWELYDTCKNESIDMGITGEDI